MLLPSIKKSNPCMQQSPNILFGFMVVFSWQRSRKMEELSTPTPGSSNDRSTPSFPCKLCPYVGKCSSNLKSHNFYRHMTPKVKSYGASELSGYQIGSIVSLMQLEIFLSFKNRVSRARRYVIFPNVTIPNVIFPNVTIPNIRNIP